MVGLISVVALLAVVTGRASLNRVRHFLWNLSAGRVMTSFLYPGSIRTGSETTEWVQKVGAQDVTISRGWGIHSGGPQSTSMGAGGGIGLSSMANSYERIDQDERKGTPEIIGIKNEGVAQSKPLISPGVEQGIYHRDLGAREGRNGDYDVHK